MNKDSKKNPAPIAPVSAGTENASGLKFKTPSASPKAGTLVKKKGAQAADPYKQAKPSRKNVKHAGATSYGARYGVGVKMNATIAPEAGATQSNGRIFASAIKRQSPNFQAGSADLN